MQHKKSFSFHFQPGIFTQNAVQLFPKKYKKMEESGTLLVRLYKTTVWKKIIFCHSEDCNFANMTVIYYMTRSAM